MGGSSNTKIILQNNETPPPNHPVSPPTNLMQNLITWINALYSNPSIKYTGDAGLDYQDLFRNLTSFTMEQFQAHYNYPYLQNETNPPNCTDPSTINSAGDFVNCPDNDSDAIGQYLSQTLIPNIGLPNVYQRQAISDLYATISAYLVGLTQGWQFTPYHRVYVDPTGKVAPYAIDAYFTFTNVYAVDYTNNTVQPAAPILFLRFIGVAYQTKAPAAEVQGVILANPNASIPSTPGVSRRSAGVFIQAGPNNTQAASGTSVPAGMSKVGTLWIQYGDGLFGN